MEGIVVFVMNIKVEKLRKNFITFLFVIISIFIFTNIPLVLNPVLDQAQAVDLTEDIYYNSDLKLTTPIPDTPSPPPPGGGTSPAPKKPVEEPIINWFDFQSTDGSSELNQRIDVNQEYKFSISVSSDQGWDDINIIDIKAWYDNGDETTVYNQSKGGNINLHLRYENYSGIAKYYMLWPDEEVTIGNFTERKEIVQNANSINTECYTLTFYFTPGYQFRYAPGDGVWDNSFNKFSNLFSWNFMISITDSGEKSGLPITSSIVGEFGVNSYSEIVTTGVSSFVGQPGENTSVNSDFSINTRSNLNYSIAVDFENFNHVSYPEASISNNTVWIIGGELADYKNFDGLNPIFIRGSEDHFAKAADNDTISINNVDLKCNIPFGQLPGNYSSNINYQMMTQL